EVRDADGEVVGSGLTDENGDYTLTTDTPLVEGDAYDVVAIDAAGNESDPSLLIGNAIAPATPSLTLDNDTGADDNDGITSDGTVNVGNLEPDATWEYSLDGGDTWVEGVGESFELPDGDYTAGDVIARQTDAAGNTSGNGSLGAVIIDSAAPEAPTLVLDNDTGADDSDGITSDGTVNVG
ncbi:Ig-like domain-containing protein, partial [Halomonas sp. AOP43-A1-21]